MGDYLQIGLICDTTYIFVSKTSMLNTEDLNQVYANDLVTFNSRTDHPQVILSYTLQKSMSPFGLKKSVDLYNDHRESSFKILRIDKESEEKKNRLCIRLIGGN